MDDTALANVLDSPAPPGPALAATPPVRYHELDSIRGLAALTVVFHHFREMWMGGTPLTGWHHLVSVAARPFTAGRQAVFLFFVLSGFVLSVPYLRGKGQGYGTFLVRRILRIYAPYLCALALALAGNAIWHGPLGHGPWADLTWSQPIDWTLVFKHIAFIGDYKFDAFNTAFWSLVMEMRLSIVFPFLLALTLFVRNIGGVILAICLCFVFPRILPSPQIWPSFYYTLQIASVFVIGILLAVNINALSAAYRRLAPALRILFAALAVLLYLGAEQISNKAANFWGLDIFLTTLGASGFILIGLSSTHASAMLNSVIPKFLGRISYSLYLVHATVLFALTYALGNKLPAAVQFVIYLVLSLGLATLFCLSIEEPFMHLSRRVGRAAQRSNATNQ